MIDHVYPMDDAWMNSPIKGFYQVVHGMHGEYVHAKRSGLEVLFRISDICAFVTGSIQPFIKLDKKLRAAELSTIYQNFLQHLPNERLAWVAPAGILFPAQKMSPGSVRAMDPFDPKIEHVLFDVHSHNTMPAYFSSQDNKDESRGFRVYIVIGLVGSKRPQIRARIGAFGHFMDVPIEDVAELPKDINFENCYGTD